MLFHFFYFCPVYFNIFTYNIFGLQQNLMIKHPISVKQLVPIIRLPLLLSLFILLTFFFAVQATAQNSHSLMLPPKLVFLDTCAPPKVMKISSYQVKQAAVPAGNFVNYNTEQGLALSSISCGFKDKNGNLWFGTFGGGVSRYDGKSFTTFSNSQGLTNNIVKTIAEDNNGNLWIGAENGPAIFDGKSLKPIPALEPLTIKCITKDKKGNLWLVQGNKILRYTTAPSGKPEEVTIERLATPNKYKGYTIRKIFEDKRGYLWFATEMHGVFCYTGKSLPGDTTAFVAYTTFQGLANNAVESIEEDNNGDLWFATHGGVSRFDGKSFTNYTVAQGLVHDVVLTVKKDKNGNIWFGTNNGVSYCNEKSLDSQTLRFTNYTSSQGLAHNIVMSITEDNSGNIWFGTFGGGVSRYNGPSVSAYSKNQGLINGNARSITEDRNGNLWFGLQSGEVSCFDGKSFTNFKIDQKSTDNVVLCATEDKNGNLWFGSSRYGAICYNGKPLLEGGAVFTAFTKFQGLVSNSVRCIIEDKNGNLWFGTNGGGVTCYTPAGKSGKDFCTNYGTRQGLTNGTVWSILEDKTGAFWFATSGGLFRYDGKSFVNYTTAHGLADNIVKCISEDKNGNLWFGTMNGISCLNNKSRPDSKTGFISYTPSNGLGDNVTYDMAIGPYPNHGGEVPQNALFIGTNQGFSLLTGFKDKNGKVFSFENSSIGPADEKFKTYSPVFEIYNSKSGYPIKDLNTNAMCVTKFGFLSEDGKSRLGAGIIWGGCGDDKVIRFDVSAISKNTSPLYLVIQSVKIDEEKISWYDLSLFKNKGTREDSLAVINEEIITFGKVLSTHENDTLRQKFGTIKFDGLSKWYPIPQNLILPFAHNNITFEFLAIETGRNFLVCYQYILEGYDKDWSPLSDKTSATFGNISEGTYTFKLKALSPFGVWGEPLEYTFTVLAPWWRTWWMYALYLIAAVLSIGGLIKWRERNLQKEKVILEEKVELRTKQLDERNKVVEEKNKDILDSIHYAKRIQEALLKEEGHTSKHLPEHFVLFMPKDIVSGDFYWAMEKGKHWYVAAVDCTGHGVPGAFMSMLGMSFLNDILSGNQLLSPSEILDQLCNKVVKELRQTGESGGSKDGMDISLIRIDLITRELQWAGANNALNIIQNGQLYEIKADKQPIGYYPEQKPFTNHVIQLQANECVYIFTDGYADQFGGPKGKKFKYKQLEDLIFANHNLPAEEQKMLLKKTFIDWKGNLEQIDDVCVIGIKC
jgi:ligand-binding sensor domain-containing protein